MKVPEMHDSNDACPISIKLKEIKIAKELKVNLPDRRLDSMLNHHDDSVRHMAIRKSFARDCKSEASATSNICTEKVQLEKS